MPLIIMNFAIQLQYNRDKIENNNELFGSKPWFPTLNNSTLRLLDVIVPLVAGQMEEAVHAEDIALSRKL